MAVVLVGDGDVVVAVWPVGSLARPDLSVVDALARLQLAARREGCSIRLRNSCDEVRELLDLVGLGDVVADAARLPLEARREAEGGEELGVEEAVEPGDESL